MEWNVKNAMNRDVEREHLNKILKEIASRFEQLSAKQETATRPTYTPPVVQRPPITVTLTGDVTGTATGSGSLTIETSLAELVGGLEDAPDDGSVYWRGNRQWLAVPLALQVLDQIEGEGLLALSPAGVFENREIVGTEGEIDVENGNGIEFNPTLSLADVGNNGTGQLLEIDVDTKGRVIGYRPLGATFLTDQNGEILTDQEGEPLMDNSPGGVPWDRIVETPTTLEGYGILPEVHDVASLPSVLPAPRQIFLTGVGVSTFIPAYSDGVVWRKYSDDSVLS